VKQVSGEWSQLDAYEKAVKVDPGNWTCWNSLEDIYVAVLDIRARAEETLPLGRRLICNWRSCQGMKDLGTGTGWCDELWL
jgi:hypothetical protein